MSVQRISYKLLESYVVATNKLLLKLDKVDYVYSVQQHTGYVVLYRHDQATGIAITSELTGSIKECYYYMKGVNFMAYQMPHKRV